MAHYGTLVDAVAHWNARGYDGTPTTEMLETASAFVDGLGWRALPGGVLVPRFPGKPTSAGQSREWPRTDAVDVYGRELASDTVPAAVETATYEAAWHEYQNPGALNQSIRADQNIAKEQFGDVSFSYFVSGRRPPATGMSPTAPVVPAVMTAIAPVLNEGSNPYGITGVVG